MTGGSPGNSHAPAPASAVRPGGNRPRRRPLVLGHRGSPGEAPENTLRSFDLALRAGADGVELDVRPTRDGVAVVVHDDSLDRAFGVRRRVSALAWAAVERLSGAQVPSFEQVVAWAAASSAWLNVVAWAAASSAWLNVEVKAAGVEEEVVRRIRDAGIAERVVISSFEPEIVRRIGTIDSGLLRYFLTERWDASAIRRLAEADAAGVCLRVDAATPAALGDVHGRGLPAIVWTVNEPRRVRELLEAGVAGIISDDPRTAAEIRNALAHT